MCPFSTSVKRSLHLARRLADGDRARDVGGAVEILGARVDQKQLARLELAVGRRGDAVVDDGAVGPAPEMVSKLISFSACVSRGSSPAGATAAISSSLPFGASRSSQARKRTTAAPSRLCAARAPLISAAFLRALGSRQGSAPAHDRAPCRP